MGGALNCAAMFDTTYSSGFYFSICLMRCISLSKSTFSMLSLFKCTNCRSSYTSASLRIICNCSLYFCTTISPSLSSCGLLITSSCTFGSSATFGSSGSSTTSAGLAPFFPLALAGLEALGVEGFFPGGAATGAGSWLYWGSSRGTIGITMCEARIRSVTVFVTLCAELIPSGKSSASRLASA